MGERVDLPLANAILQTLHYADIFDYPLTRNELHRFLIGLRASPVEIESTLTELTRGNPGVEWVDGFLTLSHRQAIVAERARLHTLAQQQLPRARFYARLLAHFPFVRMVALTGSLTMENARDADIDFLIVCAPGRLWTVRGLAVALVRLARLHGDHLCPNFLLSENALAITNKNLYSAHEIVQMIPLYGFDVYRKMRQINPWADAFLPNANGIDSLGSEKSLAPLGAFCKRLAENVLNNRVGAAVENLEMTRKIRKLSAQIPPDADNVEFSGDVCRGFFIGYGRRVLAEFERRTKDMELKVEERARVKA